MLELLVLFGGGWVALIAFAGVGVWMLLAGVSLLSPKDN